MKCIISSIIFASFLSCLSAQSTKSIFGDDWTNISSEENICYEKALEADIYEFEEKVYNVYSGQDKHNVDEKYLSVVAYTSIDKEARKEWKKVNRNSDCLSADPNDCLRNRHQGDYYKRTTSTLLVVTDTIQIKEFKKEKVITARLVTKRRGTKKVQVLCGDKITDSIQESIINNLEDLGFLSSGFTSIHNKAVKQALFNYQIFNALPLGYLDYETLSSLKVL